MKKGGGKAVGKKRISVAQQGVRLCVNIMLKVWALESGLGAGPLAKKFVLEWNYFFFGVERQKASEGGWEPCVLY